MSIKYILFKNVNVIGATGTNCYYVYGIPSIMSFLGLADSFKRKLCSEDCNGLDLSINSISVMPIIHSTKLYSNRVTILPSKSKINKPQNQGSGFSSSLSSNQKVDFNVSLIFKIDENDVNQGFFNDPIEDDYLKAFRSLKSVVSSQFFDIKDDSCLICDENNIIDELKKVRRGYCFNTDTEELFNQYKEEFGCPLKAIYYLQSLIVIKTKDENGKEKEEYRKPCSGIAFPTLIGYNEITKADPKRIKGDFLERDNNYFVEPVIGINKFESLSFICRKALKEGYDINNHFFKAVKLNTFYTFQKNTK